MSSPGTLIRQGNMEVTSTSTITYRYPTQDQVTNMIVIKAIGPESVMSCQLGHLLLAETPITG